MAVRTSGLFAFLLVTGVAQAEPRSERDSPERDKMRGEIFDQLRTYRMWKITEELKLDQATAARLFPIFARYDEQSMDVGRQWGETYRDLKLALEAQKPDNARLETLMDRFVALRARRGTLEVDRSVAVRKVLTPVQSAKLIMLLPRIDDSFRHRIHEALGDKKQDGKDSKDVKDVKDRHRHELPR